MLNTLKLSIALAKAEFKLKNEGSYLGLLWYLIYPLSTFFLLNYIFSHQLGKDIGHYTIYLFIGIIIFNFFRATTTEATKAIYEHRFILMFLIIFVYGASLLIATITIFFMDFEHIWSFCSQLLWLATPIFYSIGDDQFLLKLNYLNPIFYFITLARDLIIYSHIEHPWMLAGLIGYALLFLWLGELIFRRWQHKFPEMI